MKHPIQPLAKDEHGTLRFKKNHIVEYLLDNGGIDLNDIARKDFSREDREQFAQLIGYSLSGYGELGYVSDHTYDTAERMHKQGLSEKDARIADLESKLDAVRRDIRRVATTVFRIHPDDLHD